MAANSLLAGNALATQRNAVVATQVRGARCPAPFTAQQPRGGRSSCGSVRCDAQQQQQSTGTELSLDRRTVLGGSLAAAAALSVQRPGAALANQEVSEDWEKVDLPIDPTIVLLDIGFTGTDPNHGFLLGSRQTLLETKNGGKDWEPRTVAAAQDDAGINYRFTSISFAGDEGWIVGKPAILLHTTNGGKDWERVPLSAKLPGDPVFVHGVKGKPGCAEMATSEGAIYATDNGAQTWKAAVQETVDATLNRTVSSGISGASYYEGTFSQIARAGDGTYVAVSSRGNFFLTWTPGQTFWQPHNRPVARRLQNMGWTPDNQLWVSTRGGDVLVSPESGVSDKFEDRKISSRGFGILDVGFRDQGLGFACGGSGSLFKTLDGGKTWKRDKATDNGVAGNLYAIKWTSGGAGFVLGNDAILLRYI